MKKALIILLALGLVFVMSIFVFGQCTTIQSGTLHASDGSLITPGYDDWGYNYEAHIFNGTYCDAYRNAAWCQPYKDINLIMKWNDPWLSNKDCDGDGLLDRHFGDPSYIGSGAWLTNHQSGKVELPPGSGKLKNWTYFCKIVAVPADAKKVFDRYDELGNPIYKWVTTEGILIGPDIWGEFALIEEVYNDPSAGAHGKLFKSPAGPGFGIYGKEGD